jgi:hypothetical protein
MIVEVRGVVELSRYCRGFRYDICNDAGQVCPGHIWQLPQYFSATVEDYAIDNVAGIAQALLLQRYSHYDRATWKEFHLLDITHDVELCNHCVLSPCTHDASICLLASRIALCRHCVLLLCCTYSLDRMVAGLVHADGRTYDDHEVYRWDEATAAPLCSSWKTMEGTTWKLPISPTRK